MKSAAQVRAERLKVAAKIANILDVAWIGTLMVLVGLLGDPRWLLTLALPTVLGSAGLQLLANRSENEAGEDDGWLRRSAEWDQGQR